MRFGISVIPFLTCGCARDTKNPPWDGDAIPTGLNNFVVKQSSQSVQQAMARDREYSVGDQAGLPDGHRVEWALSKARLVVAGAINTADKLPSVWILDKQRTSVGKVLGLNVRPGDNLSAEWETNGSGLAIVIERRGVNGTSQLQVGTLDFQTLKWTDRYDVEGVTGVCVAFGNGHLIVAYSTVLPVPREVVILEVTLQGKHYRRLFRQHDQVSPVERIVLSPDGREAAFNLLPDGSTSGRGVWLLDIASANAIQVTGESKVPYYHGVVDWFGKDSIRFIRRSQSSWALYQASRNR